VNSFKVNYLTKNSELIAEVEDFIKNWNDDSDCVYTNTSGSTGKPKKIEIKKEKMVESATMTCDFLSLQEGEKVLLCLSPKTIAGKMMIVRSIVRNLELYVVDISSNPLKIIDFQIDFIAMVPLQLEKTLELNSSKLKSIRNCIIGGGDISFRLKNKLVEKGITVYHTFGMTETISHIAMRKVGLINEECFQAIGINYFSVEDDCLIIHSPLLDSSSLKTNDIVQLVDNKKFIWKGRADFVINSGGVKIHPEEVEEKLSKFIDAPFFITYKEDELYGQIVILIIETETETEFELNSQFRDVLSKYEIPKEIYFLKEFERTDSGKINRLKTKELILNKL
jgi:O-succinylbenzoic acid--CoA ligase